MKKPLVIVAGLGRCGSSLTMQMLHFAGMPCFGDYPAFEPAEVNPAAERPEGFFDALRGQAVKLLLPDHIRPPTEDVVAFWVDRHPVEQSKSSLKFCAMVWGMPVDRSRSTVRKLAKTYRSDRALGLAALPKDTTVLKFEQILAAPDIAAATIAERLAQWWDLDTESMQRAVLRRAAACRDDLKIEQALVGAAERAAVRSAQALRMFKGNGHG